MMEYKGTIYGKVGRKYVPLELPNLDQQLTEKLRPVWELIVKERQRNTHKKNDIEWTVPDQNLSIPVLALIEALPAQCIDKFLAATAASDEQKEQK